MPYNDVDFYWSPTASGIFLTKATPFFYESSNAGCQKGSAAKVTADAHNLAGFPNGTLAQPPHGANGLVFSFSHDDSKASCWSRSGAVPWGSMAAPEHARFAVFKL
jgi:hypothetical protein